MFADPPSANQPKAAIYTERILLTLHRLTSSSPPTQPSGTQTPLDTMSKIIVYEHVNFQGLSREFTSDVSNLIDYNFNDCISSLKVVGNPWVAYRDVNFCGPQLVFEEGEYSQMENNDTISSLHIVTEDLTNPQLTLYVHVVYQSSDRKHVS